MIRSNLHRSWAAAEFSGRAWQSLYQARHNYGPQPLKYAAVIPSLSRTLYKIYVNHMVVVMAR